MPATLRRTGALLVVLAALTAAALATSDAVGQVRAPGGVTIHDDANCAGQGNAAKVIVPFSAAITGLTPNSTTSQVFVTDKDASPEIVYGPFVIPNVDSQGTTCLNIADAPAGSWKVDVVEEGSGFTDSKVFSIEDLTAAPTATTTPPTPPTITLPPATTTLPPTTVTTAPGATTTGPTVTTTPGATTTGPTTSAPTSAPPPSVPPSLPPIARPWALLPWTLGPSTSVPTATLPPATTSVGASGTTQTTGDPGQLPATGGSDATALVAVVVLGIGLLLVYVARKFRVVDDA